MITYKVDKNNISIIDLPIFVNSQYRMNVEIVDCIACIVDADVNLLLVTKVKMFSKPVPTVDTDFQSVYRQHFENLSFIS